MLGVTVTAPTKPQKRVKPSVAAPHIGIIPKAKKHPDRGDVRYGKVYAGTLLRRRYEGVTPVAPQYVGVDTLSLVDRLVGAFADADKVGAGAVVVDGVTYPKLDGRWYIWKRPRAVIELLWREQGLSEQEIAFRLVLQRYEEAKSDLLFAFGYILVPDEQWDAALEWERKLHHRALKMKCSKVVIGKITARVYALEKAITAHGALQAALGKRAEVRL